MKIVTPLTAIECYEPLVNAGADEFFCGVIPYEWLKAFNNAAPFNRREYLYRCNICTMNSLKILSRIVEKKHVPVKITLNSIYYDKDSYGLIEETLKRFIDLGFRTFIIADVALLVYLRDKGLDCDFHLSGESGAINRLTIRFYNRFGISRYVFSRKTTIGEMKSCIEGSDVKGLEYEAFLLNELCPFTGAYCNTIHCDEMSGICRVPYHMERINKESGKYEKEYHIFKLMNKIDRSKIKEVESMNLTEEDRKPIYRLGETGCGVCKIGDLRDAGITHLKVVGRGNSLKNIINDVKNVRDIIQMTELERDNMKSCTAIKEKYFPGKCPEHCYYP